MLHRTWNVSVSRLPALCPHHTVSKPGTAQHFLGLTLWSPGCFPPTTQTRRRCGAAAWMVVLEAWQSSGQVGQGTLKSHSIEWDDESQIIGSTL